MSLDGVIDAPTWTFDYGFDPKMGQAIGALTERSGGILLGRTTYEMFEPAWSTRTAEDDPGAGFFADTTKYVVSATLTTATWRSSKFIGPYDRPSIRSLKDEVDRGHLCNRPARQHSREARGELVRSQPVRDGGPAVEDSDFGQRKRAGADADEPRAALVRAADRRQAARLRRS